MRETKSVIRNFVQLTESNLTLANLADDIRERTVIDRSLASLGRVDDLFVDEDEVRVRYLRVVLGSDPGGRQITFLVPTEAITEVSSEAIRTDLTRSRKMAHPLYDPGLVMRDRVLPAAGAPLDYSTAV